MIISDGTTDITITQADEVLVPSIEKSTRQASGGRKKAQTGGERLAWNVRFRATPTVTRSVLNLLTNGANDYYYTPEETYTLYTSKVTFPIIVDVTNFSREWDNRNYYYISFTVTSEVYI